MLVMLVLVLRVLLVLLLLVLLRVLRLRLARARPPLVPGEVRRRGLDARDVDPEHVREDAVPRDLRAGARGRRRRAALELLERLALEDVRALLLAERVVRAALRALAGAARAADAAAATADAVEREQPVVHLDLGALQEAPGTVRAGPYHLAGRFRAFEVSAGRAGGGSRTSISFRLARVCDRETEACTLDGRKVTGGTAWWLVMGREERRAGCRLQVMTCMSL